MILLDDFTEANGATWFLTGSHLMPDPPAEEDFYARAQRLLAPAGSVCYFTPRIYHAGGHNHTDRWRHTLITIMQRPWMKQRLDIPRLLATVPGFDPQTLTDNQRQKLGYTTQVPASYDEFYQAVRA